MTNVSPLKIDDLQDLCDEHEEESLTLEFKACNELRVGSALWEKSGSQRDRRKEDVLIELTKDVTAFLNSAGGTIVYGILEKNSRAERLDKANAFNGDDKFSDVRPEQVVHWLRAHIQPSPAVNVYRIFEDPNNPQSPWYLLLDIPQGQQAYLAKDHRFYKRVGATVQPMEQYEVADVMNRQRAAALDLRVDITQLHSPNRLFDELRLDMAITSTNYIASEYGALKLTAAYPITFCGSMSMLFQGSAFDESTGLFLGGDDVPHASSIMTRWGAHNGNVIFPGDWYNFYGNGFHIQVPKLSAIQNPVYLFQTELFTLNSQARKAIFAIGQSGSDEHYELIAVDASNSEVLIASFWQTYHEARKTLKK